MTPTTQKLVKALGKVRSAPGQKWDYSTATNNPGPSKPVKKGK